jgi:hypothetical protein
MLNSNNSTTILGLIAGITEILLEFEYIDRRIGGVIVAFSFLGLGFLSNNSKKKTEDKWRKL